MNMNDKENFARVTRASKKRGATANSMEEEQKQVTKKRVVLGELSNHQLGTVNEDSLAVDPKKKKKKDEAKDKVKNALSENDAGSEDPKILLGPYCSDIYNYLRTIENNPNRRPFPDYIAAVQKDISVNMRSILVDWLVEVAEEYKLVSDTLHLSISYMDRFLSVNPLLRGKLQLLGVSAMLIASKYEEITPPHVEEFCYIMDNSYTREEVLKMEADILKLLKFELGNPTVRTFLRIFTKAAEDDIKNINLRLEFLTYYLAELSLLDYNFVKFVPSLVAASVIFLARFIMEHKSHPWSSSLQEYSGYKPDDLKECVLLLHDWYVGRRGATFQSIREKYKQHKFKNVAAIPSSPDVPAQYFEDLVEFER